MSGRRAKKLRRAAQDMTVGQPARATRLAYKTLKREHKRRHRG